jgi:hypothetical protein
MTAVSAAMAAAEGGLAGSCRELTNLADISRLLHEVVAKERAIDGELEQQLGRRGEIEKSLLLLNSSTAEVLELMQVDAEQLQGSVANTADLADRVPPPHTSHLIFSVPHLPGLDGSKAKRRLGHLATYMPVVVAVVVVERRCRSCRVVLSSGTKRQKSSVWKQEQQELRRRVACCSSSQFGSAVWTSSSYVYMRCGGGYG